MISKQVTIGSRSFPSQTAAIDYISTVLNKYDPGVRITGDDEEFVRDLFFMHPDFAEKLNGHAVSHFEVAYQSEQYKRSRSFIVVRSDGQRDDFSSQRALKIRS